MLSSQIFYKFKTVLKNKVCKESAGSLWVKRLGTWPRKLPIQSQGIPIGECSQATGWSHASGYLVAPLLGVTHEILKVVEPVS